MFNFTSLLYSIGYNYLMLGEKMVDKNIAVLVTEISASVMPPVETPKERSLPPQQAL